MVSSATAERGELESTRPDLRPVPEIVDWVLGALLVLVGLAVALGGTALLYAIDRSEIREMVADEEIQSDVLTNAELVDVTQATATWSGVGLIATGAILFAAGFVYVVLRHRTHQRAEAGEPVSNVGANALLGAMVAVVLSWLPFSQAIGGVVAGYLERGSTERTAGVGALSGFLSIAPVLVVLAFVLGGVMAGLLGIGEGALALVVAAALLLTLGVVAAVGAGLGALGGYVGGRLHELDDDSADEATA